MTYKILSIFAIVVAALTQIGCATLADAKNERGSGEARVYSHSKEVVWNGLVDVLESTDLEIVSENKVEGIILAERSMTAFSYGENVAIFVEEANKKVTTRVEIVNKRTLATNITAADWADRIFSKLDEELEKVTRNNYAKPASQPVETQAPSSTVSKDKPEMIESAVSTQGPNTLKEKLDELKILYESDLISEEVYLEQQRKLLEANQLQ